jgi:hypothetical protein
MPNNTITRWTVSVSRQTDMSLRTFLAQRGMKKSDPSKFIEAAVKWRLLDQTMVKARVGFSDTPGDPLETLIDGAVNAAGSIRGWAPMGQ